MENPPQLQLMQAAVFFSAGIAVGVVYDVCRAVRRCSKPGVQQAADVLFVCGAAALLYVLGMDVGVGQLRIFMVSCLICGAVSYSALCSAAVVPLFIRGIRGVKTVFRGVENLLMPLKNFIKKGKNIFPKRSVWSKMNGYSFNMRQFVFRRTQRGEAVKNSGETDGMDGLHSVGNTGNLRRVEYSSSANSTDPSGDVSQRIKRKNRRINR